MEDSSGFYKNKNTELIHAPNGVIAVDYLLDREQKDTYEYPIDGWYWFNSIEEALAFFPDVTQEGLINPPSAEEMTQSGLML